MIRDNNLDCLYIMESNVCDSIPVSFLNRLGFYSYVCVSPLVLRVVLYFLRGLAVPSQLSVNIEILSMFYFILLTLVPHSFVLLLMALLMHLLINNFGMIFARLDTPMMVPGRILEISILFLIPMKKGEADRLDRKGR